MSSTIRRAAGLTLVLFAATLVLPSVSDAHVKKIVIEKKESPAFDGAAYGAAGQYETLAGRAFGELDPKDPHNALITDIALAPRNARGMVEYIDSFFLVKPIDMSKSSHLMWHGVPNRGGRLNIGNEERIFGDIGLSSGWQGDNSGRTVPGPDNDWVIVPIAKNADGSPVSGLVFGRIVNARGLNSQPMIVNANPVPYKPATLETTKATLTTHTGETVDGKVIGEVKVPATDWAWAKCSADSPFPGTPDPTQICVKGGFDPKLLYQVVFTSNDDYVLGIGFAAFRDIASFFKYATKDDEGTANPVGGGVTWIISRGQSQSGNFLRLHSPRLQPGRSQPAGGRWRVADHRGQAHLAEHALCDAGRCAEAVRAGRRRSAVVGRLSRQRARPAGQGHARSLHRDQDVPEDSGALRVGRGVGAQPEPRARGHQRRQGHPAAGQRAALLHSEHRARRRQRRLQRDARGAPAVPRRQLRHRHSRGQSRAAHRDGERAARPLPQLGDEGHAAAGEHVPDAGRWHISWIRPRRPLASRRFRACRPMRRTV